MESLNPGTQANVPGIAAGRVTSWICERVDMAPPLRFEPVPGGRSNPTYIISDPEGRRVVLRRPPLGHVLATAHDVAREYRVMSAFVSTGVPVPATLGLCTDTEVNGAPFYLMSFVDGQVVNDPALAVLNPGVDRAGVGRNLIDVLVDMHAVDVDAIGLGDLGRRDGYVERQLRRWKKQLEAQAGEGLEPLMAVHNLLAKVVPTQQGSGVAHGDYRLGNTIIDGDGRIKAVLDWELVTLGDGLADLGWLLNYWPEEGEGPEGPTIGTQRDLIDRYAAGSGKDSSQIMYYLAFAKWRAACILSGVYVRFTSGAMTVTDDAIGEITENIKALTEDANAILEENKK